MNEHTAELNAENTIQDLVERFTHYLNKKMYTKCREVVLRTIQLEYYEESQMMQKQLDIAEGLTVSE